VTEAPADSARRAGWPAVNPADAAASHRAGLAALDAGTEIMALPLLDAARAFHPREPRLWHVTGLLHRALDDLAPAVAAFEKAAALAPRDPVLAHDHARAALDAGLPSIYLYDLAHRLAPLDGEVLLGMAAARNLEEGPGPALDLLDEQLGLHPEWVEGHMLFARLSCVDGRHDSFASSLERALALRPRDIFLWRELVTILIHAELFDHALGAIGRGRAAAGPHLAFDANEAVCFAEMGDTEAADRLFGPLEAVEDLNLVVRRIRHLIRSGRADQAAALAEPLLDGPGAPFAAPYLSIAWRLLEDPRWDWLEGDERLVGVYDLAEYLPPLDLLATRLRSLHKGSDAPLEQSLRGGTQTHSELFARIEPELRALRRAVVDAVGRHIDQLPPPDPKHPTLGKARDALVRFSGSWSVRLRPGGHHINHIHPDGWLSSALYVALPPPGVGDPHAGWLALGGQGGEIGVDLLPIRLIEPKPGRLVLFPSTMLHRTLPFEAGERLTIAFDVAPPR
jgi:tetratricopeptide (TPR) repeat protein